MTQTDLLRIALAQSAIDLNCAPEDLISGKKIVVESVPHPKARAYLRLPFACNLVSYGGGVVASVSSEIREIVTDYIEKYPTEHLFETPNLHALDDALAPHGLRTCFMAEYFLPDLSALRPLPCKYDLRLLQPGETQRIVLRFPVDSMASYDDTGAVQASAWVLEAGDYRFFVGANVEAANECVWLRQSSASHLRSNRPTHRNRADGHRRAHQ